MELSLWKVVFLFLIKSDFPHSNFIILTRVSELSLFMKITPNFKSEESKPTRYKTKINKESSRETCDPIKAESRPDSRQRTARFTIFKSRAMQSKKRKQLKNLDSFGRKGMKEASDFFS